VLKVWMGMQKQLRAESLGMNDEARLEYRSKFWIRGLGGYGIGNSLNN